MSKIILKYITKDKHTNTFCTEKNKKQYKNGFNSVQNMNKYQIYWYIYKNKKQNNKQKTKQQTKTNRKKETNKLKRIDTNQCLFRPSIAWLWNYKIMHSPLVW
jgi:hypothetical protein